MKIKCEKCGNDITAECNTNIENYTVGRIKCPNCNTTQKRYISEADVLLFFTINEVMYTVFTFVAILVFNKLQVAWWTLILMMIVFALYYVMSKYISSYIYLNAPFKKDIMNKQFQEDGPKIKKNLTFQFMIFFAVAITSITFDSGVNKYFFIILPIIPLVSFIKLYFQLKYEKNK